MNQQILLKLRQVVIMANESLCISLDDEDILVIMANESLCISLDDEDIRKDIQECMHSVVAFSFEGNDINTNRFRMTMEDMTMEDVWHSTEFTIQRLDTNFYQILFQSGETVEYILRERP